jgi:hypothetical protein
VEGCFALGHAMHTTGRSAAMTCCCGSGWLSYNLVDWLLTVQTMVALGASKCTGV